MYLIKRQSIDRSLTCHKHLVDTVEMVETNKYTQQIYRKKANGINASSEHKHNYKEQKHTKQS